MSKIETNTIKPDLSFFENELDNLILSTELESKLDNRIEDIESYMRDNNGEDKSEEEKDQLYHNAQKLHAEYVRELQATKYNLFLNRDQNRFLTNLIMSKLEYDVNTVFFAIEVKNIIESIRKNTDYKNDSDLISYPVDATEITYIYHLISPYKVKGLTKEAYLFSQVLVRIGGISKIFNYYNTANENLKKDIHNWVAAFDPNVIMEGQNVEEVISDVN